MSSLLDRISDKERDERAAFEAGARAQIHREMDEMGFDSLMWFWKNRKKILAQKNLIDMIYPW